MFPYVILDGKKYAVQQGTYVRKWARQFTATLSANIVELNFIDRGPGIQTYDFTLILAQWGADSLMYKQGITSDMNSQITALETLYSQVNTQFQFVDPYGNSPKLGAVYMTDLQETIPNFSTPEKPTTFMTIELIAAIPAI